VQNKEDNICFFIKNHKIVQFHVKELTFLLVPNKETKHYELKEEEFLCITHYWNFQAWHETIVLTRLIVWANVKRMWEKDYSTPTFEIWSQIFIFLDYFVFITHLPKLNTNVTPNKWCHRTSLWHKEMHAKRRNLQSVIEHDVKHIFLLVFGLGNEIVPR
jgi:hypothetical protein